MRFAMSASLICPECGATELESVGEKRYHCTQCGAQLWSYLLSGDDTPHCDQCRAIVLGDARFCHQCGAELQIFQELVALRDCPACGRPVPVTGSYCPYCRTEMIPRSEEAGVSHERAGPPFGRRESVGCPACGRTIGNTAQVCRYCGVNIEEFIAKLRQEGLENLARAEQREEERRQYYLSRQGPILFKGPNARVSFFAMLIAALTAVGLSLYRLVAVLYFEEYNPETFKGAFSFLLIFTGMTVLLVLFGWWDTHRK